MVKPQAAEGQKSLQLLLGPQMLEQPKPQAVAAHSNFSHKTEYEPIRFDHDGTVQELAAEDPACHINKCLGRI